ncbi:hypothetical protein N9A45_00345 [bacterium]|nr:hypothetical protein [bacterium]
MLFERFVFVLYVLSMYTLFFLGTLYESGWRYLPLLCMSTSLLCVIVVTLFQLQQIVRRNPMLAADRWSTVAWSGVHVFISFLFVLDGFEWVNVIVILCVAGLLLTCMILIVGVCSCYVIILNGQEWAPHIHLTCICFWVLVQYMSVRLPLDDLKYVTTVPVVAMACLRLYERVEDGCDKRSMAEMLLWVCSIVLHVCLDVGLWLPSTFYWCLLCVVCGMIVLSRHMKQVGMLVVAPFACLPLCVYASFRYAQGYRAVDVGKELTRLFDEMTAAKSMEPFELSDTEEDFVSRL